MEALKTNETTLVPHSAAYNENRAAYVAIKDKLKPMMDARRVCFGNCLRSLASISFFAGFVLLTVPAVGYLSAQNELAHENEMRNATLTKANEAKIAERAKKQADKQAAFDASQKAKQEMVAAKVAARGGAAPVPTALTIPAAVPAAAPVANASVSMEALGI